MIWLERGGTKDWVTNAGARLTQAFHDLDDQQSMSIPQFRLIHTTSSAFTSAMLQPTFDELVFAISLFFILVRPTM